VHRRRAEAQRFAISEIGPLRHAIARRRQRCSQHVASHFTRRTHEADPHRRRPPDIQSSTPVFAGTRADLIESLAFAGDGLVRSHDSTDRPDNINAIFDRMKAVTIDRRVVMTR
jgi:hypothetical protein